MVKQIITDMQKELNKSIQSLGKAILSERIAKKQYDDAIKMSSEWENIAKSALISKNEDFAKKALENKVKFDKNVVEYKKIYDTISQQTETIRTQVDVLKSKLEEAKNRQTMLIARSQMADVQKTLAKSIGGFDISNTFEKFNRMEEKVSSKEAEVQAYNEIIGQNNEIIDEFEKLEKESLINSELERLKVEISS